MSTSCFGDFWSVSNVDAKANKWRTRTRNWFESLLPGSFWIKPWSFQKIPKRSANDEKWRDYQCTYFLIVISTKTSASGEVEENQKNGRKIQIGIYFIFRIWSVSDLDKEDMFFKRNIALNHHRNVEEARHNRK